jgi:E3 ubiquitin-protein ligase BOI-like protein
LKLEEQRRILVSAFQEIFTKKLKEKDEEIQRMGKLNWALQERVRSLYAENQIWRELAQNNEATANTLRSNLEQVLAHAGDGDGDDSDAESSCGSNPSPSISSPAPLLSAPLFAEQRRRK